MICPLFSFAVVLFLFFLAFYVDVHRFEKYINIIRYLAKDYR